MTKPKQKGRRCNHPKKDGSFCTAWALTVPDEDGMFRCTGHSTRQEAVIRREANKLRGRVLGGRKRKADNARAREEVLELEQEQKAAKLTMCPRCGYPHRPEPKWPKEMDFTQVTGPAGQNAWRQAVFENRMSGAITEADARTYTAIIRDASTSKPPTPGDSEITDEASPMAVLRGLNEKLLGRAVGLNEEDG